MILPIAQIVVSILLIALILIQERTSGLSGILGGDGESGGFYHTRRGLEKAVFWATILTTIAFVGLAFANLLL